MIAILGAILKGSAANEGQRRKEKLSDYPMACEVKMEEVLQSRM